MKILTKLFLLCLTLAINACDESNNPTDKPEDQMPIMVEKTNDTKVYMHYMPWFHSKDISGFWGSHWQMANKNPDRILGDKREIAAHYYPLIGPYDSRDPDVVDYHLLLMKYAGIDGVLVDWYGSYSINDYGSNLKNSNALINRLTDIGLGFAVVYEEYTTENVAKQKGITAIEAAQADMNYLESEYFSNPRHITIDDSPLLMTFGPRYFRQSEQWTEILSVLSEQPKFLPLWGHGNRTGSVNSHGEFSWVDFDISYPALQNFYDKSNQYEVLIGSAYPGFHDYYQEGGWGDSYGFVDHADGQVLESTLAKAQANDLKYLQLVTWNDFGEGTMIEPTVEFGYKFLLAIQAFTGVDYGEAELALIYDYHQKRKAYDGNESIDEKLDQVFTLLNNLQPEDAKVLLDEIE